MAPREGRRGYPASRCLRPASKPPPPASDAPPELPDPEPPPELEPPGGQRIPNRHPPLLDPPLLDPPPNRPPEELLPELEPAGEEPPEQAPLWHVCPTCAQFVHVAPPRPHDVSLPLVSQLPDGSQQPLQPAAHADGDEGEEDEGTAASSPLALLYVPEVLPSPPSSALTAAPASPLAKPEKSAYPFAEPHAAKGSGKRRIPRAVAGVSHPRSITARMNLTSRTSCAG
jgi:hypothetical protein